MGDRARGVVLYGLAALLLAAGVLWWFQTAPRQRVDPRLEQWRSNAQRLLPDLAGQEDAGAVALPAGAQHQVVSNIDGGEYTVWIICVGGTDSQVRVSLGSLADDSGRGLDCAGEHPPHHFSVGVGHRLRMNVSVGEAGPVVFRYAVVRLDG